MTLSLSEIWRHPLKAVGREQMDSAALSPGEWLPFDRLWAVSHSRSKLKTGWVRKANFLRGVTEPALMAVTSKLSDDGTELTLTHPSAGVITIRPDEASDWPTLEDWLGRIWPADLPAPSGIYRASDAHLTDVEGAWLSVHTFASHRAVERTVGHDLSTHRWRGNLWIEGADAWDEMNWVGRQLQVGAAVLDVKVQITRCKATMANPETGLRDADTLGALKELGHQEFGVYAEVVKGGTIQPGDVITVL